MKELANFIIQDSSMKWLTQDMRKLEFENEEFDCVIDKAGMDISFYHSFLISIVFI